jgi:hypothetical protein
MADKKISQLTGASTPLAGTEVLPIVQSGSTVKVSAADITAGRNISASGLTLSGGTANGVLYLNASKAASAGSVLTFDETTVNLAGSTRSFRSTADSGTAHTSLASDGVYAAGTDLYLFAPASKFVSFYSGGSEKLRLESSGNLVVSTAGKGIDFSANTHAAGMTSELLDWYEEGSFNIGLTTAGGAFTAITIADSSGTYTRIGRQVTVRGFFYTSGSITGGSGQVKITGLPFSSASISVGSCWVNPDTGNYNSPVAAPTTCTPSGTEILLFKDGATNNPAFDSTDLTSGGNSNYIAFYLTYFV